jgi:hypothetical protein
MPDIGETVDERVAGEDAVQRKVCAWNVDKWDIERLASVIVKHKEQGDKLKALVAVADANNLLSTAQRNWAIVNGYLAGP